MTQWKIDASHSSLQFTVRHMVITKVRGSFKSYDGTLDLDTGNDGSLDKVALHKVAVVIDASSIDTHEPKRDGHLRSSDFLDVAAYPTIEFESRSSERRGDRYTVQGDLTIHGVTRPVTLDAEFQGQGKDPWGGQRVAFSARTRINREDFGLTWNQVLEAGGVLVGTQIDIEIEVQAVKAAEVPAREETAA